MPETSRTQNNLGAIRRMCRLSINDVALLMKRHLGKPLSPTTVSAHESGRRNPTPDIVKAYSQIYKVESRVFWQPVDNDAELRQLVESNPLAIWKSEADKVEPDRE